MSSESMEKWMAAAGIWWNKELLRFAEAEPSDVDSAGFGLWAAKDIEDNDHLCTIPKSSLLSIRNTAIADLLEAEELGGGLGLVFACMFERARSTSSPWHGYLEFLGAREFLPMFWPEEILQIAEGTCLDPAAVKTDAAAMQEDFTQVESVMKKYPDRFKELSGRLDFEAFRVAASWVSSRAFYADSFHGQCLVPLADIFNHKASIVEPGAGFAVAELDDASDEDPSSDDEAAAEDGEPDDADADAEEARNAGGETGEAAAANTGDDGVKDGDAGAKPCSKQQRDAPQGCCGAAAAAGTTCAKAAGTAANGAARVAAAADSKCAEVSAKRPRNGASDCCAAAGGGGGCAAVGGAGAPAEPTSCAAKKQRLSCCDDPSSSCAEAATPAAGGAAAGGRAADGSGPAAHPENGTSLKKGSKPEAAKDGGAENGDPKKKEVEKEEAEDLGCVPDCTGGPCCPPDDSADEAAEAEQRAARVQQLQERLGINLGLEIAIIDEESGDGSDGEGAEEGEEGGEAGDGAAGGGKAGTPAAATAPAQLRIVAAQAIPSGQEVHNTYGEYGSTDLIYKHGFALRENPFDAVAVPMHELRAACAAVHGADAADARMRVVTACMREAATVGEEGCGGAGGDGDEAVEAIQARLEVFGADCAEAHMQAAAPDAMNATGFMAFPLFAALWCAGADEGALEAAQASEGLVPAALTALTTAAKSNDADVEQVVQEYLELFWVAKALPAKAKQMLQAIAKRKASAMAASTAKLEQARSAVQAHFGGKGEAASGGGPQEWHGCSLAEASQSFCALERLILQETRIVSAVEKAIGADL